MDAVVLCGLQGSGKSTLCRERFFDTHVRISRDVVRTRERELALIHTCLGAQQAFVVDNTNPKRETRARYLALARASDFVASLYFVDCSIEDALGRNALRTGSFRVPDLAIRGTAAKFEAPSIEEGWDHFFHVRLCDGQFVVEEQR